MSRQVVVSKAGLKEREEASPGRSWQGRSRARTPAYRLARGANSQECQGWTRWGSGWGTLAPAPCCLARGSREAPVAATHTWLHWLEASLKARGQGHRGQAQEGL